LRGARRRPALLMDRSPLTPLQKPGCGGTAQTDGDGGHRVNGAAHWQTEPGGRACTGQFPRARGVAIAGKAAARCREFDAVSAGPSAGPM
jgi:hypothetical protein